MKYRDAEVKQPKKCPVCGQENRFDIFGEPTNWFIKDPEIPSKWVCVRGWTCTSNDGFTVIFGTAIRRGPIDNEIEPQDIWEEDCSYIIGRVEEKWDEQRKMFVCKTFPYFKNRTYWF